MRPPRKPGTEATDPPSVAGRLAEANGTVSTHAAGQDQWTGRHRQHARQPPATLSGPSRKPPPALKSAATALP
ncbi:MAG: hypothetical protein WDN04_22825 [Rhodospirillales bacterium]